LVPQRSSADLIYVNADNHGGCTGDELKEVRAVASERRKPDENDDCGEKK
jgi:hypothetical protein